MRISVVLSGNGNINLNQLSDTNVTFFMNKYGNRQMHWSDHKMTGISLAYLANVWKNTGVLSCPVRKLSWLNTTVMIVKQDMLMIWKVYLSSVDLCCVSVCCWLWILIISTRTETTQGLHFSASHLKPNANCGRLCEKCIRSVLFIQ